MGDDGGMGLYFINLSIAVKKMVLSKWGIKNILRIMNKEVNWIENQTKLIQNGSNGHLCLISGTKSDRQTYFFWKKVEVNLIKLWHKIETQLDKQKSQKKGHN